MYHIVAAAAREGKNLEECAALAQEYADRIVFGPEVLSDTVRLAFIIKDDALIELYEEKA